MSSDKSRVEYSTEFLRGLTYVLKEIPNNMETIRNSQNPVAAVATTTSKIISEAGDLIGPISFEDVQLQIIYYALCVDSLVPDNVCQALEALLRKNYLDMYNNGQLPDHVFFTEFSNAEQAELSHDFKEVLDTIIDTQITNFFSDAVVKLDANAIVGLALKQLSQWFGTFDKRFQYVLLKRVVLSLQKTPRAISQYTPVLINIAQALAHQYSEQYRSFIAVFTRPDPDQLPEMHDKLMSVELPDESVESAIDLESTADAEDSDEIKNYIPLIANEGKNNRPTLTCAKCHKEICATADPVVSFIGKLELSVADKDFTLLETAKPVYFCQTCFEQFLIDAQERVAWSLKREAGDYAAKAEQYMSLVKKVTNS